VESGVLLKESGIPLTIEIRKPSSTDRKGNTIPGIRNPLGGIQNPNGLDSLTWGEITKKPKHA